MDETIGGDRGGRPHSRDTLSIWMSACKPIGAIAFAQLWEAGRVDLDAPVATVIPEFAQGGKEAISFRHVLTHSGGFRPVDFDDIATPWDETVSRICAMPLEPGWIVGETVGYHDRTSWYVMAEAIQRIDGRPFPVYVREELFDPMGMPDSWIGMPPERWRDYGERIGVNYRTEGGLQGAHDWHTEAHCTACRPGGNARGPIRDLGRFYEMLLGGGELDGVRIVSEQVAREFTRTHREGVFDLTFRHRMNWGLGFIVDSKQYGVQTVPYGFGKHCSPRTFGHGGYQSTSGFADPEHGLAVAISFNGTPGEPKHNKRIRDVASAIYEDLGLAAGT